MQFRAFVCGVLALVYLGLGIGVTSEAAVTSEVAPRSICQWWPNLYPICPTYGHFIERADLAITL